MRKARARRAWTRPQGEPSAPTPQRARPPPPRSARGAAAVRRRGRPALHQRPGGTEVSRQRRAGRAPVAEAAPRRLARARSLPAVTFRAGGRAAAGPGQRSPEASAAGAARAARRTAGPGPAPRAAPHPAGPAPPREAKPPPPPPSWPLQRGRRSRQPLRHHRSSKLARRGAGAGLQAVSPGPGSAGSRAGSPRWAALSRLPVAVITDKSGLRARPRGAPKARTTPSRAHGVSSDIARAYPCRSAPRAGAGAGPAPGGASVTCRCRTEGRVRSTGSGENRPWGEVTALPQFRREVLRVLYLFILFITDPHFYHLTFLKNNKNKNK